MQKDSLKVATCCFCVSFLAADKILKAHLCHSCAGKAELRHHLQKNRARPYAERLSDFHLLLYLAKQPNLDLADLAVIIEAVKTRADVPEGYTLIIDSLAEL